MYRLALLLLLPDNSLSLHSCVPLTSLITETWSRARTVASLRSPNGLDQKRLVLCQESHAQFSFPGPPALSVRLRACMLSRSVVSDSLWPCGLQSAWMLCPWEFPTGILEWVTIFFSRGSSWPSHQTHDFCSGRWNLYHAATWEALICLFQHSFSNRIVSISSLPGSASASPK